jgi:hypothetical protein
VLPGLSASEIVPNGVLLAVFGKAVWALPVRGGSPARDLNHHNLFFTD